MTISGPKGPLFEEEKNEMANKCPNCSREFGIRKMEGLILVKFQDKVGMVPRQEPSNGYYCTACNSHWIRPKNEVKE